MRALIERLKRRFRHSRSGDIVLPKVDLDKELTHIEHAETNRVIPTGRLIHQFAYGDLDLRLDRDMTGMYRVTVNDGEHRLYSFTVDCAHRDYSTLRHSYDEILCFLSGNRSIRDLPNHTHLKGHFYGSGASERP